MKYLIINSYQGDRLTFNAFLSQHWWLINITQKRVFMCVSIVLPLHETLDQIS
jgi:hypothetical protein